MGSFEKLMKKEGKKRRYNSNFGPLISVHHNKSCWRENSKYPQNQSSLSDLPEARDELMRHLTDPVIAAMIHANPNPNPNPQMEQQEEEEQQRDWAALIGEILVPIFGMVGTIDVLKSVRYVCRAWWHVVRDEPDIWRRIDLTNVEDTQDDVMRWARITIDRSNGRLEEFSIKRFVDDDLLQYLCDRTHALKSLRLTSCYNISDEAIVETVKRQPQLEELELKFGFYSNQLPELVGKHLPNLKQFKWSRYSMNTKNIEAFGIANTMHHLRYLQLHIRDRLTNEGLKAILEGCPYLETLDIRGCTEVYMDSDMRARHTKGNLKIPNPESENLPQMVQEEQPNWPELHGDVLMIIFRMVETIDVLKNVGFVCRAWRKVTEDEPEIWRRIDMKSFPRYSKVKHSTVRSLIKIAIDRSRGRLEEFSIERYCDDDLLEYLCKRTSVLKSLLLISCLGVSERGVVETVKRQPFLDELQINGDFSANLSELVGKQLPNLKHFGWTRFRYKNGGNKVAFGIAKTMHELRHLRLENTMSKKGLKAILEGCSHLEILDIHGCHNVKMDSDMWARCLTLTNLILPHESLQHYDWPMENEMALFFAV